MFDAPYATLEVPVDGGNLHVGSWGGGPHVVVAIHGLTLVHSMFHALGDQVGPDVTLLAPDLRGRGGSAHLGPPYGMAAHAHDVGALLRHVDGHDVTVLGYSAMASVAVATAVRHPDRVARVVMVDGGPAPEPTSNPAGTPRHDPVAHVTARLGRTYPDVGSYLDTWRDVPGLAPHWSPYIERLLADELAGEAPELHQSLRADAVVADAASHADDEEVRAAYRAVAVPVTSLRAGRNLIDEPGPMFTDATVEQWRALIPQLHDVLVPDVNHYTILFTDHGAATVADVLRRHPTTT